MKKVIVHWTDSSSIDGWTWRSDMEMKLAEITTIGFLVEETANLLCVASSVHDDDQFNGIIFIPKICALSYDYIEVE